MAKNIRKTILIVDDTTEHRYVVRKILEAECFNILEAANAKDGLKQIKKNPDLVILDVKLPDMSGFEVCKKIKGSDETSHIPVIHISATYKDDKFKVMGLDGGADGYLVHPVNPEVLVSTIKAVLRLNRVNMVIDNVKWKNIFYSLNNGALLLDIEGRVLNCNDAFTKIVELDPDGIIGEKCEDIFGDKITEDCCSKLEQILEDGKGISFETQIGKNWFNISTDPVQDEAGGIVGIFTLFTDISDRKKVEDYLKTISFHDSLTGLYNRSFFDEEMKRLENSREFPITIISTDLDKLKLINDNFGHPKGDELLVNYAKILEKTFRKADIIARLGGDEFFIICPHAGEAFVDSLLKRLKNNISIYNNRNHNLPILVSIGVSTAKTSSDSLSEVLEEADKRMYKEKNNRSKLIEREYKKIL